MFYTKLATNKSKQKAKSIWNRLSVATGLVAFVFAGSLAFGTSSASAATQYPVRTIVVIATDQAGTNPGILSRATEYSDKTRAWFCARVGKCYQKLATTSVKGKKTQAQYEKCPSGKSCGGSKFLAFLYNLQEDSNIYNTNYYTNAIPNWALDDFAANTCGRGLQPGKIGVSRAHGYDERNVPHSTNYCDSSSMAHELGHNFGLGHTTTSGSGVSNFMHGGGADYTGCSIFIGPYAPGVNMPYCTMTSSQATFLKGKTSIFYQ